MGLPVLLAQCIAMFIASMLVGSLPLMFKSASSGRQLKAVSVLGMGILVGAALTIIIPEGVSTLYESIPRDSSHSSQADANRAIGLSLLSGFALMLLIETLTPHPPSHPPSPSSTPPTPSTPLNRTSSHDSARPTFAHLDSRTPIIPKRMHVHDGQGNEACAQGGAIKGLNATLGLVIHGAADGIALGASSLSEKGNLGLIVFVAVLVHKGPTALGLTTTLLSLDLDHSGIRRRLMIFSCAAPLGAIITFTVINLFGGSTTFARGEIDGLSWWTGVALLFSGGSFLYVATVIQPLSSTHPEEHEHTHSSSSDTHEAQLGKYSRIGLLMGGMLLPVVLTWLVGDHH